LKACRNRFKAANFVFENGSIADVLRGISKIPQSDIVYASGLFDYLDDRVGGALVRRMCSALNPGGTMIIANLSPVNEEIAYMEAVMDWWMYYRDEAGFRALTEKARVDSSKNRISTYTTSQNRIVWLQVERLK